MTIWAHWPRIEPELTAVIASLKHELVTLRCIPEGPGERISPGQRPLARGSDDLKIEWHATSSLSGLRLVAEDESAMGRQHTGQTMHSCQARAGDLPRSAFTAELANRLDDMQMLAGGTGVRV